jgi:UDP-GlcNAc3NAcA epimerase
VKVATIVGARPQFVKAAMVSRELRAQSEVEEVFIHTGQHYDRNMSGVFFEELGIPPPDYDLGVGSALHGEQTGEMLKRAEKVLLNEKPDAVLVYGDTNSTLAGALAAAKLRISLAHVEAGMRSHNRNMPEEVNRVLTDHLADYLFCATETAVDNLAFEGIKAGVYNVGDVMYDAALFYYQVAESRSTILQRVNVEPKGYYLATIHRAENADDPQRLSSIINALSLSPKVVIIPLHPRTRKALAIHAMTMSGRLRIIEPVSYLDMVMLEKNAQIILTDSGGVQKEAYFFQVPCITLRDETEWVETVKGGWNRIAGTGMNSILRALAEIASNSWRSSNFHFGRGDASKKICKMLTGARAQENFDAVV